MSARPTRSVCAPSSGPATCTTSTLPSFGCSVSSIFVSLTWTTAAPNDPLSWAARSSKNCLHDACVCMMLVPLLLALEFGETDPDLAARIKRRDPQAMADLYDRYGRLAYSLILRIVRDREMAEDLVQETFLRVWTRAQAFDSERGALGPWLLAVARNRAIDYLRSAHGRMAPRAYHIVEVARPSLLPH